LGRSQQFSRWASRHNSLLPQSTSLQLPSATILQYLTKYPGSQSVTVNLQPINDPLNVIEPNPQQQPGLQQVLPRSGALCRFNRNAGRGVWWRRRLPLPRLRLLHALQHHRVPSRAPSLADRVKSLLSDYASTPCFRLEVTTEDVLTDDLLDMTLSRTYKNLARKTWTEYRPSCNDTSKTAASRSRRTSPRIKTTALTSPSPLVSAPQTPTPTGRSNLSMELWQHRSRALGRTCSLPRQLWMGSFCQTDSDAHSCLVPDDVAY
jgi:hypothetical protein